jgi:hypothetical protein
MGGRTLGAECPIFAYPLEIIHGNVLLWKLLLQACCRAMDRVAAAKERMTVGEDVLPYADRQLKTSMTLTGPDPFKCLSIDVLRWMFSSEWEADDVGSGWPLICGAAEITRGWNWRGF